MKVLACDGIHEDGLALFRQAGWIVEISDPIRDPVALSNALSGVDALLVRSATAVGAQAIEQANMLRVIGRAGAGVDTIDVDAATARGIAVMNARLRLPNTRCRCSSHWPGTCRARMRG